MVRLFIENTEIELDENVQFAITRQFEELSNPTTIINDWSKTVSIPFTVKNNKTFGHIYCPDKVTVASNSTFTGIYFDPLKKLDFRLEYDSDIVMTGYAKMNEIKLVDGNGTYEITLFGQLGKVLYELLKITFDKTTEDSSYLINGSTYVYEQINKELVVGSWLSSGQTETDIYPRGDENYNIYNFIGFAPNNSYNNDFDYKTMQISSTNTTSFEDYFGADFKSQTGVDLNTVIKNGITPRGMGEFRSYYQIPFIYWNKLFKIFRAKAEAITGYAFELDTTWFNINNKYWYNLVYILKNLSNSIITNYNNEYNLGYSSNSLYWSGSAYTLNKSKELYPVSGTKTEEIPIYYATEIGSTIASSFNTGPNSAHINDTFNLSLRYLTFYKDGTYRNTKLGNNNGLIITFSVYERKTSSTVNTYKIFICSSNYSGTVPSVNERINVDTVSTRSQSSGNDYSTISFLVPVHLSLPVNSNATINISGGWYNSTVPFVQEDGSSTSGTSPVYLPTIYLNNTTAMKKMTVTNEKRSGAIFDLNDLWNNEYNIFNEILKYCKMYRIGIFVDDINKKIKFIPLYKYFQNYSILNWTNYVDKSKDFIIKPVTFDAKYVLFNYANNDTKLGKDYREKYGVNYGDYRLITDYNFNEDETKLFNDIKTSINNSDYTLSFSTLYRKQVAYIFTNETFVYSKDKDEKYVENFGSFYFHNGRASFNTTDLVYPKVSDDTPLQSNYQTYFYEMGMWDYMTNVSFYPSLKVANNYDMCLFNIPKECYTYNKNYNSKHSIYYNFWLRYLNERYNVQNKLVTCYIRITPKMWNTFEFNKFILIDNQIYIVNKIYDYDITNTESTKVDLITIQDIGGYIYVNCETLPIIN